VLSGILQGFLKLRFAQPVIASALEMHVMSGDCFPRDAGIADPPSDRRVVLGKDRFRE